MLYHASRRGLQVLTCCRVSARSGVFTGQPVAEARGLFRTGGRKSQPEPHFLLHDPQTDLLSLEKLAASCLRFSPTVGWQEAELPDTLLLDITGCTHLFGNEERLSAQVVDQLHQQGYRARVAIADTIGAAWALAHFKSDIRHQKPAISPQSKIQYPISEILALPIEALRLDEQAVRTLRELDISRIDQLEALPRVSLPSRLGTQVIERLDQAMGRVDELIHPVQPREEIVASETFEHPLVQRAAIEIVTRRLTQQILDQLEPSGAGVQRMEVCLAATDHKTLRCSVGFVSPCTDADHLTRMIHARLERLSVPGEIIGVTHRVTSSSLVESSQTSLLDDQQTDEARKQFRLLLERISSRLGEQCVLRSRLHPDAQPEYAYRWETAVGSQPEKRTHETDSSLGDDARTSRLLAARPLVLKSPPLPLTVLTALADGPPIRFRCEGHDHLLCRSWGPERITTGWWRKEPIHRDYYRVETDQGQQMWLFYCSRDRHWFFQGEFV